MIGQTYANLFPGRVRAMMLDGIVDAVDYTTSAETRTANDVASTDEVFDAVHRAVPERRPRPLRARRSRRARRPTGGEAVRHGAPGADPGAQRRTRPASSATAICSSPRSPRCGYRSTWPQFAADLEAAVNGDATNLKIAAQAQQTPEGFAAFTTSAAISCADGPARQPVQRLAGGHRPLHRREHALGTECTDGGSGLRARRAGRRTTTDRYTGPWNATTKTPILLVNARYDPATGYGNAQVAEKRLGNAVLLTMDGWGHPSYQVPSTCIDQGGTRYLVDLVTPPRGTVCQPDQIPFG